MNDIEAQNEDDFEMDICDDGFSEEELIEEYMEEFSYQIQQRGKEYYNNGKVLKCVKSINKYYATVEGSSDKSYEVNVNIGEYDLYSNCTCPCDFPCKHEYAVLLAILNKNFEEIELKEEIEENKETIQNILKQIPADEIKEYLLSNKGISNVNFNRKEFNEHFCKYLPKQEYAYYYNNLYNSLVLNNDETIKIYFNKIKQYISNADFEESFKIIKATINAYNDSGRINNDDFVENIAALGMYLRVTYRKSTEELKNNINIWIRKIKDNNYYDNLYLEDILIMMNKA